MTKSIHPSSAGLPVGLPCALPSRSPKLALALLVAMLAGTMAQSWAHPPSSGSKHRPHAANAARKPVVVEGDIGYASFYANRFSGRTMADGTPMRPDSDNAASLTLPLGSKALVTNLRNGRTAVVTIRDRGPYVKGRIIDVSPSTARMLGMVSAGVVKVAVRAMDDLDPAEKLDAIIAAADADEADKNLAP